MTGAIAATPARAEAVCPVVVLERAPGAEVPRLRGPKHQDHGAAQRRPRQGRRAASALGLDRRGFSSTGWRRCRGGWVHSARLV